jgi:hypothetical protein
MRATYGQKIAALILLSLCASAMAASVQKWTDANGQVHYGDAPPPGSSTQSVRVNATRPSSNPQPAYVPPPTAQKPAPFRSIAEETQAHNDEVNRRNRETLAAMGAAQARTQARNDKELVDKCNASRNSYCDQGANAIRQQNYNHELAQQAAQSGAAAAQGRVVPQNQRIQPTAPCQWPQTCSKQK